MIKVNASILEDGLVEELQELINKNEELFKDSKVALMPDAHKTNGIPVGFTMTVPYYKVAPDFISSDIACGVSGLLIKDYVPSNRELKRLSMVIRDLVQVDRRFDGKEITDFGTLGKGNHFLEIGTNGTDTLISVHSGSRAFGGRVFNKWKSKSKEKDDYMTELMAIEPQKRQAWLESRKPTKRNINFVDLSNTELRQEFIEDYNKAYDFAWLNRRHIICIILRQLQKRDGTYIDTVHNYIDFDEEPWVIRKGSIKAVSGEKVLIPINMRDGIIMGTVTDRGEYNQSLPHGAGRILSRTKAFEKLEFEDFKSDMDGVISPTIIKETLDESPRAYKDLETILDDIGDGLKDVEVFKTIFNYKGV